MPTALVSIVDQARTYVRAIDYSIVAAKNGFTIAQQAIVLAKILEEPGTQITDKECDEYLSGLVRLASEGQKNAMKAVNDFRDVRVTIEAVRIRIACHPSLFFLTGVISLFAMHGTSQDCPGKQMRISVIPVRIDEKQKQPPDYYPKEPT
jgi:hypothetical protein